MAPPIQPPALKSKGALTEEERERIKKLRETRTTAELAAKFGISKSTLHTLLTGDEASVTLIEGVRKKLAKTKLVFRPILSEAEQDRFKRAIAKAGGANKFIEAAGVAKSSFYRAVNGLPITSTTRGYLMLAADQVLGKAAPEPVAKTPPSAQVEVHKLDGRSKRWRAAYEENGSMSVRLKLSNDQLARLAKRSIEEGVSVAELLTRGL